MSPSLAPDPASRGRKRRGRIAGLLIGWALLAAWLALVGWNIATAGFPAPLSRLIALPSLPWLPLASASAAQASTALLALMIALLLVLCALTFVPAPPPALAEEAALPPSAPPAALTMEPAAEPAPPPALDEATLPPPSAAPAEQSAPASDEAPGKRRVFISHTSGDNAFGYALTDWLRAELGPDYDIFYDSHGGEDDSIPTGEYFQDVIQAKLMASDVFVVIETPAAMKSKWVQDEIGLAWSRKNSVQLELGLVIAPVLLGTCDIPPWLTLIQYADLHPGADEAVGRARLLAAIRRTTTLVKPLVTVGPPFDLSELRPADHFIGRVADVEWVMKRLTGQTEAQLGVLANIAAANGQGGIGKTALAAEVVRRLMTTLAFPDGIAALDCRDQHGEADALGLLQTALSRFTDARQKPQDDTFAALGDVAQRLLRGKRALVVFDNVEADLPASKLVAPLRTAGAAILLTSRAPIAALPNSASLRLDLLPEDDALALFLTTYGEPFGRPLTGAERHAARAIVVALGRHTLAVKLAAANAATQQRPLAPLAAEFKTNPLRDAWLEDSETAVTFVLGSSVAAMSPGGQRLFAALGAFSSADIGRKAALAVALVQELVQALGDSKRSDVTAAQTAAERSLRWILDLRLADPAEIELPGGEQADRERLRLHPLTQAYARDLFAGRRTLPIAAPWGDAEREQANRALAAWYAHYTMTLASEEGIGYLALTSDEANITGALDWTMAHGDYRAAASICRGMGGFWRDTGRAQAGLRYLLPGSVIAERIADQSGARADCVQQTDIAAYLGDILRHTGHLRDAKRIYLLTLHLCRAIENRRGESATLVSLGQIAMAASELDEAVGYLKQSLYIAEEVHDRPNECAVLISLGNVALRRGELEQAESYFRQALVISHDLNDQRSEGAVLGSLGTVLFKQKKLQEAESYLQQALAVTHAINARQNESGVLTSLGYVALQRADLEQAENYFRRALVIDREIDDRRAEAVDLMALADVTNMRGQYAEAAQAYRESIAVLREAGDRINVATGLEWLGTLLLQHSDDRAGGIAARAEAIMLWQAIGLADREQASRRRALAEGCRADELPPPSEGNAAG